MAKALSSHVVKITTEVDPTGCPGSTSQCLTTLTERNFSGAQLEFPLLQLVIVVSCCVIVIESTA